MISTFAFAASIGKWTSCTSGMTNQLINVTYGNSTNVAVGQNGTILQMTFIVTYNGNGSTGGNAPTDSNAYICG